MRDLPGVTCAKRPFEELKTALLNAPVLRLANVDKEFRVVTDASDFVLGAVLLQQDDAQHWHPVAFASKKLSAAEKNYTAAERETLAVVYALKCWRIYLFRHFELYTDNMAVVHLRTKPHLSKREARWVECLADYDFTVYHHPGRVNIADALSRRSDLSQTESNPCDTSVALSCNALEYSLDLNTDLAQAVKDGYTDDRELRAVIDRLQNTPSDNFHDRYYYDDESGLLYLIASPSNRLCIPQGDLRLELLQEYHDCITAAHPGRDRTYFRLSRFFYWPRMGIDVKRFVKSCDRCQRAKAGHVKSGLLQPLSVPTRPWEDIPWILLWVCPVPYLPTLPDFPGKSRKTHIHPGIPGIYKIYRIFKKSNVPPQAAIVHVRSTLKHVLTRYYHEYLPAFYSKSASIWLHVD